MPYPLYGYTVGQENQSISNKNLIRRMDQNAGMVTRMICTWKWEEIRPLPKHLRKYMISFMSGQILGVELLFDTAGNEQADELRRNMWKEIMEFDPELYRRIRRHPNAAIIVYPGPRLRRVVFHIFLLSRREGSAFSRFARTVIHSSPFFGMGLPRLEKAGKSGKSDLSEDQR